MVYLLVSRYHHALDWKGINNNLLRPYILDVSLSKVQAEDLGGERNL